MGIEGNVDDSPLGMYVTGWAAVVDRHGEAGIGAGGRFLLPEHLAVHVRGGAEFPWRRRRRPSMIRTPRVSMFSTA